MGRPACFFSLAFAFLWMVPFCVTVLLLTCTSEILKSAGARAVVLAFLFSTCSPGVKTYVSAKPLPPFRSIAPTTCRVEMEGTEEAKPMCLQAPGLPVLLPGPIHCLTYPMNERWYCHFIGVDTEILEVVIFQGHTTDKSWHETINCDG